MNGHPAFAFHQQQQMKMAAGMPYQSPGTLGMGYPYHLNVTSPAMLRHGNGACGVVAMTPSSYVNGSTPSSFPTNPAQEQANAYTTGYQCNVPGSSMCTGQQQNLSYNSGALSGTVHSAMNYYSPSTYPHRGMLYNGFPVAAGGGHYNVVTPASVTPGATVHQYPNFGAVPPLVIFPYSPNHTNGGHMSPGAERPCPFYSNARTEAPVAVPLLLGLDVDRDIRVVHSPEWESLAVPAHDSEEERSEAKADGSGGDTAQEVGRVIFANYHLDNDNDKDGRGSSAAPNPLASRDGVDDGNVLPEGESGNHVDGAPAEDAAEESEETEGSKPSRSSESTSWEEIVRKPGKLRRLWNTMFGSCLGSNSSVVEKQTSDTESDTMTVGSLASVNYRST